MLSLLLSSDPRENTNIAKHPDQAAMVERLMARWKQGWRGALPPNLTR